ncbi:phosphoribosylformylglycinamidine synthase [bacterium]|nr:phosphoribosylformylglycinamidine synthase [bacterium]
MTITRQSGNVARRVEIHDVELRDLDFGGSCPGFVKVIRQAQVFWITGDDSGARVLYDPVLQTMVASARMIGHGVGNAEAPDWVIDVRWRAGVTDNRAQAASEAMGLMSDTRSRPDRIASGDTWQIWCDASASGNSRDVLLAWARQELANPLVQEIIVRDWKDHSAPGVWGGTTAVARVAADDEGSGFIVRSFPLNAGMEDWLRWSSENSWALNRSELQQVRDHYANSGVATRRFQNGLPENPTDVEMEIIAQTWSEHCKHKIFAATIDYREQACGRGTKSLGPSTINGLFKSEIVRATREVQARRGINWLSSTFSDNAGLVRFDDAIDVSIKVETHNSPSALDPYGGALTGILGVNRDILGAGMGARPVANTDVLCFGPPNWTEEEVKSRLPSALKHPRRIMEGVHRGIQDGGNKSGIPVVNGAFVFDEGYCGKPLVYCGTIGVSPARLPDGTPGWEKRVRPGDLIVMAGGRVGKDGIHGATFSSLELNEDSPLSAVQIGDPLTQKRLADFILAARDAGLYSGITDNGAGGLSSSVGEMAQLTGGASIEASLVPLKYPGLKPWEIVVSESQERMTVAVPESCWPAFAALAEKHGVEVTRLGAFDESGEFRIHWHGKTVGCLSLEFLHKELRPMELRAVWEGPQPKSDWICRRPAAKLPDLDTDEAAFARIVEVVLSRPDVASKERWVRRFDHEVQAATVGKPFTGVACDGPGDAGVIWLKPHGASDPYSGVAVASGINSKLAHVDTYISAQVSLDEAVRNLVSAGADPDQTCLVDNFCWPDPLPGPNNPDHAHKTAQLVRACRALSDTAIAWGMPFVSGKDSMKNDFAGVDPTGRRVKISVPPTVLVTAMGKVPDVRGVTSTHFRKAGDSIYLVGPAGAWPLDGSEFARAWDVAGDSSEFPSFDLPRQMEIYRRVHKAIKSGLVQSCHDISDGGAFTTIAESSIGGRLGAEIDAPCLRSLAGLFHEGPGRFIVSVEPRHEAVFSALMGPENAVRVGAVTAAAVVQLRLANGKAPRLALEDLLKWWKGTL